MDKHAAFDAGVETAMVKAAAKWGEAAGQAAEKAGKWAKGKVKTPWIPIPQGPTAGQKALGTAIGIGAGGAMGHHFGKKQRQRGEEYSFGLPQFLAATMLAPAGTAYQVGRYYGHHPKKKGK